MNKAVPVSPVEAGQPSPGSGGEIEAESRPVATKVGGPNSGQGASKSQAPGLTNGSPAANAAAHNGGGNGSHGSNGSNGNGSNGHAVAVAKKPAATAARIAVVSDPQAAVVARHEQFASFQADAPSCDRCGAITARAGNCYLCYNCGNSMGCS
jgi:ribonucleoside-diphosphate reductase alpha chain